LLEAELLSRALNPPGEPAEDSNQSMTFDIVDAHRGLATLGLHGHRLSRQFNKALDQLRIIQTERMEREVRELKEATALLEFHKHKGLPWQPSDHGFVFSLERVERFSERRMRLNQSRHIEYALFD